MTMVSYTAVSTFMSCPREFYYRFILNLTPKKQSEAITNGVVGHSMMEKYYKGIRDGVDPETARQSMQTVLSSNMTVGLATVWAMVDNYVRDMPLEGEVKFVEDTMVVPISHDLEVAFTVDFGWIYNNKWIELDDYKFIGRKWSNNKELRYTQLDLYNIMLRLLGYPVKQGNLRFFNLETRKIYKKVYDSSYTKLNRVYDEFVKAALKVKEFLDLPIEEQEEQAIRTLNYNLCHYCHFVYVCDLELEGKDASNTMKLEYTKNTRGSIELLKQQQEVA